MVTTICVGNASITSTANTTQYWSFVGGIARSATETAIQMPIRAPGTLSKLYLRITANSLSGGSMTVKTRKNGADGGQSFTVGAGATGVFEDTTNSDSITAGDKICVQTVPPATGTFTATIFSLLFEATTDTVSILHTHGAGSGFSFSTASTTWYFLPSGYHTVNNTTEDANTKVKMKKAGTCKQLAVNINTNARTTDTIFRSRKNGANGNQTITVGSGATGFFEDTSNSDTIAVDDDYNYSLTTGTGTQTISVHMLKSEFVSTAGFGMICGGWPTGSTVTDNTNRFHGLYGDTTFTSTEADTQVATRAAFTFSNLTVSVNQNGVSSNSTARSRKNTADGGQTVTITASTTGVFTDASGSDTCDNDDLVNYQIVVPSVAGTQTITVAWIAMWSFLSAGGGGGPITMTNDNTKTYSNKFIQKV